MESLTASLVDLQEEISELTARLNKARGQKELLLSTLKKELDIASVKEGKKLLPKLKKQIEEKDQELTQRIQALKDKYGLGQTT